MTPLLQYTPNLVNHNIDFACFAKVKKTVRIDRIEFLFVGWDAEKRPYNGHQIPNATPATISLRNIFDFVRETQEKRLPLTIGLGQRRDSPVRRGRDDKDLRIVQARIPNLHDASVVLHQRYPRIEEAGYGNICPFDSHLPTPKPLRTLSNVPAKPLRHKYFVRAAVSSSLWLGGDLHFFPVLHASRNDRKQRMGVYLPNRP